MDVYYFNSTGGAPFTNGSFTEYWLEVTDTRLSIGYKDSEASITMERGDFMIPDNKWGTEFRRFTYKSSSLHPLSLNSSSEWRFCIGKLITGEHMG